MTEQQQHCDTCNDIECQFHAANLPNWKTSEQIRLRRVVLEALRSIGCASHSSRPSPQPDALSSALDYDALVSLMVRDKIRSGNVSEIRRLLTKWIAELRQQHGGERR